MKKSIVNITKTVCATCLVALTVSSCSKSSDLYDPSAAAANEKAKQEEAFNTKKTEYATKFESTYGPVKSTQSWDFSMGVRLGTRAITEMTIQPVSGLDFGASGKQVTKNKSVYDAIEKLLPEGKKQTGEPVVLVAPECPFYVFPISTRCANTYKMTLNLGFNKKNHTLYTKDWVYYDVHYVNGMYCGYKTVDMPGAYVEAPVGTAIEIYMAAVNGNKSTWIGTQNGKAIYLDLPKDVKLELPDGITVSENAEIKFIGIEDGTDDDYNDAVLAIVGNPIAPTKTIISEDQYVVNTNITKRYMVEDLGAIGDFDFNDVVVDVTKNITETHKVTKENGEIKADEVAKTEITEKAVVRALGGTLDIALKIGDTTWSKSGNGFTASTMYNTTKGSIDYDKTLAEFAVTGWDPNTDNIRVEVKGDPKAGDYQLAFPKTGEVPMIMAFDYEVKWANEGEALSQDLMK